MSRENALFKNTIILAIGRFLPSFFSIITLPILTAELSKADYGTWDLIGTLVSVLLPIATLQIQSAAFRFLIDCRNNKEKCSEVISCIYIFSLPILILVSIIIAAIMRGVEFPIRVVVCLYFASDMLYLTTSQVIRGLGNNKLYSVGAVINSTINVILIVTSVKILSLELFGVILSGTVGLLGATILLFASMHLWQYIKPKSFSKQTLKELLAFSWPMVPNNLSNWVLSLSDRLVITAFLGVEANATYAVANKIPNLLSIAQSVFVMAWQENAAMAVKDKDADKYFSKMFDSIFSLIVGITALLIAFTPLMFEILIQGDYDDAYYQMPLLFMGMFFYCMSAFQGGIYIAHKKTKSVGVTTMGAAAINLIIDFLFVNVIGITAGSLSTLTAYLCLYIFRMKDVLEFQKIEYNIKKQVGLLALVVVMLVLCYMRTLWCDVVNIVFGVSLFVVLNKDMVLTMLKSCLGYLNKHKVK